MGLAAANQILCHSLGYEWLQKSKDSLKACFEKVNILYDFLATVKAVPHECVIRTGQPKT